MSENGISPGVLELATVLRDLQRKYRLDSIAGTMRLPDGHAITLRWSGSLLELERDTGEVVLVPGAGLI